jgi:hypothetical protein
LSGVRAAGRARSRFDEPLDQWANRRRMDTLDPSDHHRAAALDHAEHRRLFRRQGPPTPRPLQPAVPSASSGSAHRVRTALVASDDVDFIALDLPGQDRFGLARHDPFPERLGHPLGIARVQPQLAGDLRIR